MYFFFNQEFLVAFIAAESHSLQKQKNAKDEKGHSLFPVWPKPKGFVHP
jgi:hypothetical protein